MTTADLTTMRAAIARVVRARGADASTAEDIAQETLTRLLAVGDTLEPQTRLAWAFSTAGNLLVDAQRQETRARRHQHRLLDLSQASPSPEGNVIALEEAQAVRTALDGLDDSERRMFLDHASGVSTIDLASATESNPAAIAARLHRTRARMRLDYLLALRRVQLPTVTCRRVLLAVSAADRRRQRALHAADHLEECATCTELVTPLVRRSSRLAGIAMAPLIALGRWGGRLQRGAQSTAVQVTAVTAAAAAGAGIYFATRSTSPPPPPVKAAAPAPALRTATGTGLLTLQSRQLAPLAGQRVIAQGVRVQSAVSGPGFWVGNSPQQRVYVHMDNANLVAMQVRAGQRVSFAGVLTKNAAGFARTDGVDLEEGARLITVQGVHITVDARNVRQAKG